MMEYYVDHYILSNRLNNISQELKELKNKEVRYFMEEKYSLKKEEIMLNQPSLK